MTSEKLRVANDLSTLIDRTKEGINQLKKWIGGSKEDSFGGAYGVDKNYNLYISEHGDGSGNRVDITRYLGNTRLLAVILKELEEQLAEYKKDWEKL